MTKVVDKNLSNTTKALKLAHRRKWILTGAILFTVILTVCAFVYHQINESKEKVIASEYAAIDFAYSQEKQDHNLSMAQFRTFSLKYPQNPYGWQAALRSSAYFISNNNLLEAQKQLEAILPYTSNENLIQIKIRTALAGIYADQNNVQKSLEQLVIVENLPRNPFPNQSRFLKAQILITAGNKTEARKVLNQIISTPSNGSNGQNDELIHQAKIYLEGMNF